MKNLVIDDAGPIRTITLNRPQALNALNSETLDELTAAVAKVARDASIRCVILTGAGAKAFVAGADIAEMVSMGAAEALPLAEKAHALGHGMEALAVPVIAAVNGFALGGGLELALACDFIYASENARLGFPEVGLGVIPGFGGTQRLASRVGIARACELIYTGRLVPAADARAIGLVNEVVPQAELLNAVKAVALAIAEKGPLAIRDAKRAMHAGWSVPLHGSLDLEKNLFAGLFATQDQKEGMRAFVEKRKPVFQGK